jgi:hypothetical protein
MSHTETRPRTAHQGVTLHTAVDTGVLLGGCSDQHVYRLIAAGELRSVDISTPGSRRPKIRVRSDDIADYIDRQTSKGGRKSVA